MSIYSSNNNQKSSSSISLNQLKVKSSKRTDSPSSLSTTSISLIHNIKPRVQSLIQRKKLIKVDNSFE